MRKVVCANSCRKCRRCLVVILITSVIYVGICHIFPDNQVFQLLQKVYGVQEKPAKEVYRPRPVSLDGDHLRNPSKVNVYQMLIVVNQQIVIHDRNESRLDDHRLNIAGPPDSCPRGFTYLASAGSCYKVVHESHDWTSAAKRCQKFGRGSHLVVIKNEAESNALKTFLTSEISKNAGSTACIASDWSGLGSFFWTSGQRKIEGDCKYPFVWKLSSEKQLPFEFTNWLSAEPSCGDNKETCMHLWATRNFGWNDIQCNVKICPLCEYNP